MTLLVTGGAGFIGSNFILQWLKHSSESVINLDKLTYSGNLTNLSSITNDERYIFVEGDILNKDLVTSLLEQHQIRALIHFAAESHVDRAIHSPEIFVQTNINGTFQLLEAALGYWRKLPSHAQQTFRFVHISTDEVYGDLREDEPPFHENTPYAPNSPYSASKAASDHLARSYHRTYGLPVLITNCSNNYGAYQYPEKLIPLCIHKALSGQPIPVYGNGLQIRDWLYVTDHCVAIERILDAGRIGEKYNIGGLNEQKNIDLIHLICSLLDRKSPRTDGRSYSTQIMHVQDRPGHDVRYGVDITKLQTELSWQPQETFISGIEKTVDWYLTHQDWMIAVMKKCLDPIQRHKTDTKICFS